MKFQWPTKFLLSLFVVLTTTQAFAEDSSYILCKLGREVRTMRVEKKGNSFIAIYTKDGIDHQAGKAMNPDISKNIIEKIQGKLEYAQWKCKDVSQTRVSSSAE